jgi:hypothetical protein
MALNVTVSQIIDQARIQDARFFDVSIPDGALVLELNRTQRTLLLKYADSIQGLLDQSLQVATSINGNVVGVDGSGNPYYLTTPGTGWAVSNAGTLTNPIPYVDFSQPPIALDPFGQNGGTPGFPLPPDIIKIIHVVGVYLDGTCCDIDIVPEVSRNLTNTHNPAAFLNGNRMVPVRDGSPLGPTIWQDLWNSISSVTMTWIGVPSVAVLTDVLTIPVVLHDALVMAIASLLAQGVSDMAMAEKAAWAAKKVDAINQIALAGTDMLNELTMNTVLYRE